MQTYLPCPVHIIGNKLNPFLEGRTETATWLILNVWLLQNQQRTGTSQCCSWSPMDRGVRAESRGLRILSRPSSLSCGPASFLDLVFLSIFARCVTAEQRRWGYTSGSSWSLWLWLPESAWKGKVSVVPSIGRGWERCGDAEGSDSGVFSNFLQRPNRICLFPRNLNGLESRSNILQQRFHMVPRMNQIPEEPIYPQTGSVMEIWDT